MESKPFNPFIAAIWRRLAETLLAEPDAMQISAQQVVDNLQAMFANIAGPKPRETALAVLACWIVLGGPLWHFAPRRLRIRRIEQRLKNTRVDLFQDMARIRGIVYAGYYGHWLPAAAPGDAAEQEANAANPVLASIGFVLPRHRARADTADDPAIALHTANDLPDSVFLGAEAVPERVEVVVIGSGAGGAVAAANLADQGYEVLVIEAGPYLASTAITPHELRMSSRLFKDGAIQTTRDRDIIVFQGRAVGGSTVINNGICLRLAAPGETHPDAPDVLAHWAALGAPIPAEELAAAYARIEARLGIHTIDHRLGRSNGTRLLAAWQAYRAATPDPDPMDARATCGWFRKNWGAKHAPNACLSCGYCNTGCPYGRKNAMPESFLAHATCHAVRRARILPEAEVRTIAWGQRAADGRRVASAVQVVLADGRAKWIGVSHGVVVAAGAIASSNLLAASGIAGTGRGISLNIACPVPALMAEEVRAWDEDQMATYIDRGDFLIESHFQPPMSMATLVPGWFDNHFRRMRHYNRLISAGVLFPADRRGQIKRGKLAFRLAEEDLAALRRALGLLAKVHFAGGAQEVYPALLRGQTLRAGMRHEEIDRFLAEAIREPDDVVLSSSHPHGGNAINTDPARGVVDCDQRVHGTTNVLVCDASVMPSCIRVNAQLTTMAMADRVTHGRRVFG